MMGRPPPLGSQVTRLGPNPSSPPIPQPFLTLHPPPPDTPCLPRPGHLGPDHLPPPFLKPLSRAGAWRGGAALPGEATCGWTAVPGHGSCTETLLPPQLGACTTAVPQCPGRPHRHTLTQERMGEKALPLAQDLLNGSHRPGSRRPPPACPAGGGVPRWPGPERSRNRALACRTQSSPVPTSTPPASPAQLPQESEPAALDASRDDGNGRVVRAP